MRTAAAPPLERRQASRAMVMVVFDVLTLAVAFLSAGVLAMTVSEGLLNQPYTSLRDMIGPRSLQVAAFGALVLAWHLLQNHYTQRIPTWIECRGIVIACFLAMMGDGFLQFATKEPFSRLWLVFTWFLAAVLLLLSRSLCRIVLRRLDLFEIRVLLIGGVEQSGRVAEALQENPSLGYVIAASITPEQAFGPPDASWRTMLESHCAKMVILAINDAAMADHAGRIRTLALEGIPFLLLRDLAGLPVAAMEVQHLVGRELILLSSESRLGSWVGRMIKYSFDHVVAALLVVALSPVMLLIGLTIRLGGGPVFFVHDRIGRNGREFPCLKFRTMLLDADLALSRLLDGDDEARRQWQETRKLKADPRVTRFGAWLRRTSLDELPQLFNVLRGEMSLVGPRPIVMAEQALYGPDLPFYTFFRPGITGLWQVSGRNDIDMTRRIALDRWYASNWSLWLDIVLLAKTVPTVLRRRGAY